MEKFILYKRNSREVKVINKKPSEKEWQKKGYGFAEGPFRTNQDVCNRLGMMNRIIPTNLRKYCN